MRRPASPVRPAAPAAIAVMLALALPGCGSSRRTMDDYSVSSTPTDAPITGRASLEMAIPVPGADACIVPFAVESRKGWFSDRDPFTRGGRGAYAGSRVSGFERLRSVSQSARWHNAVIKRFNGGPTRQVLDRRGVISQYSFFGEYDNHDSFFARWIVFIATTDDTNGDGLLNDRDASRAIIASPDGAMLLPVTPADGQVWGVTEGDRGQRFYFEVVHDTNADQRFDEADEAMIYTWTPSMSTSPAEPVVSDEQLEALKRLVE